MENQMKQTNKYILECEYSEPDRPYSQQELRDMINNLKKKLKIK